MDVESDTSMTGISEQRLCGVTGWPLEVTASPGIHRALCERDAIRSVMLPLPRKDIRDAISFAESNNLCGLAVTVPHKVDVLEYLDDISPEASAIGAVNTVVFRNGRRIGYNTDGSGFATAITAFLNRPDLRGMRIALIGSGGAAKAIAYALRTLTVTSPAAQPSGTSGASVTIYARHPERAAEIANRYGFGCARISDICGERDLDLIVQCTSVGNGDPYGDPIPDYSFTGREALYDLVYAPAETHVMRRARAAGSRAENGMSMLIAQAERQHRLFHADQLEHRH